MNTSLRTLRLIRASFVLSLLLLIVIGSSSAADRNKEAAQGRLTIVFDVPAGKYTAFILTGLGAPSDHAGTAEINMSGKKLQVAVGPGNTIALPFGEGWSISANQVSIKVSRGVKDFANVTAWGISTNGPVEFPEKNHATK